MKVYHRIEDFTPLGNAVVTSGMFDGVHLGHRKIIARLLEVSRSSGGESVVITFWPHPRTVVSDDCSDLKLLSTLEEKTALFELLGVQHLLVLPFTRAFSELSSDEFIRSILVKGIGTKKLVIGYDHRFGKNREGSFAFLKEHCGEYGFEVEEIASEDIDNLAVSSSRIRKALFSGDVEEANHLLGYDYALSGTVVKGDQIGRTLGYPTANLLVEAAYKLVPLDGVYAIRAEYNHTVYQGMLSIGLRPTVDGKHRTIEANLFDFNKEIYGEPLTIRFCKYLRPEEKFDSLDALTQAIRKDKEDTLRFFAG
ncbi:bifunctional riboflavin kinase/FAD synthetase [Ravibacter arvi]|uniref:Riboflavin biosynthesis protein n=1 Tax=Ravibacter arvi TaxID=2051041 RepID=A0ABP8M0N7_9BACT